MRTTLRVTEVGDGSEEIRAALRAGVAEAGGAVLWATANGVDYTTVYRALNGAKVTPALAKALGYSFKGKWEKEA